MEIKFYESFKEACLLFEFPDDESCCPSTSKITLQRSFYVYRPHFSGTTHRQNFQYLYASVRCAIEIGSRRGHKAMMLSDVCLSVAYIGPKSRTERPRKNKIDTEVAQVTRDSNTTFKVKRSKVKVTRPLYLPPCWRVRQLQRWAWERVGREKLMLRCRLLGRARPFGTHGEGEGRGHIVVAARLQLVTLSNDNDSMTTAEKRRIVY